MSAVSILAIIGVITYYKVKDSYEKPEFEQKYGTLIEGVNL